MRPWLAARRPRVLVQGEGRVAWRGPRGVQIAIRDIPLTKSYLFRGYSEFAQVDLASFGHLTPLPLAFASPRHRFPFALWIRALGTSPDVSATYGGPAPGVCESPRGLGRRPARTGAVTGRSAARREAAYGRHVCPHGAEVAA
jgi:hypothetical protein